MRRPDADRCADRKLRRADVPLQVGDVAHQPLGDAFHEIERRAGDHQDELIAAIAADQIFRTRATLEQCADVAKNAVTDQMAEGVIDRLEIVEIEEHQRERPTLHDQLLDLRHQEAAVDDAGQLVARGQAVQVLDHFLESLLPSYEAPGADELGDDLQLGRGLRQEIVVARCQCGDFLFHVLLRRDEDRVHVFHGLVGAQARDEIEAADAGGIDVHQKKVVARIGKHLQRSGSVGRSVGGKAHFFCEGSDVRAIARFVVDDQCGHRLRVAVRVTAAPPRESFHVGGPNVRWPLLFQLLSQAGVMPIT